jgi:hypothetical protein
MVDENERQWRRQLRVTAAAVVIGSVVMASTFTWEPASWRVLPRLAIGLSTTSAVILTVLRWRERRRPSP